MNLGGNTMQLLNGRTYAFQWDSDIYVILPKAKIGEEITSRKSNKRKIKEAIRKKEVINNL